MRFILGAGQQPLGTIFEAGQLTEAIGMPQSMDLVLLDIEMPGINGLEGLALVRRRWPDAAIVMLSAQEGRGLVQQALQRGAMAFVSKTASPEHIRQVAQQALRQRGASASAHSQGAQPTAWPESEIGPLQESTEFAAAPETGELSPRQLDVLNLLCEGLSNKAIANRLIVSENTVRTHMVALLRFFDVATRTEAVVAAQRLGVVKMQASTITQPRARGD
ncbi:MAG: response regulator transcription factor [Brachymonas sp.]|nr:response regulator transcription factor [Brachymonas sp.]